MKGWDCVGGEIESKYRVKDWGSSIKRVNDGYLIGS